MTYVTKAALGFGCIVKFELTDGVGDYAEIEELQEMPESGGEASLVEATHTSSPTTSAGRLRNEYIAGPEDGEETSWTFAWSRTTTQEAVRAAVGATRRFQRYFSATANAAALTQTFQAVILSAPVTGPTKEKRMMTVKVKVTGAVTES